MRLLTSFYGLALARVTLGLRFDLQGRSISPFNANTLAATGDDHSDEISSTSDVLYIANVTIDGTSYPLQMDTGSSDLWVQMQSTPANVTTNMLNVTYGTGYAYGPIARGAVSFAGWDIPDQAYLVFQQGNNPILHFGAVGIVGLGFTGLSHIDAAVDTDGTTWGRSLLYNIFALNPAEPNFIAMALERVNDQASNVQGSLGVGEVADEYANITSTAHIPLFPPQGSTRWTVLLDSFAVNGVEQTVTSVVTDVPDGRVSVLLDSGTTYSYAPPAVANAIYSGVSGAVLDTASNTWQVPCSAGIRLTLWIAGRPFDIHPLDVVIPSLADSTKCIGSFIPTTISVGSSTFDWILGTNVLRSLYALYDFGDFDSNHVMGDPYVQLLSVVDINAAATDFQSSRGGTVNVDSGNGSASSPVTVLTTDEKLDKLMNLVPMMFAVLGANALIFLTLLAGGLWLCCYIRRQKRKPKKAAGLAPLQLSSVASRDHAYEAVNTDDVDERPSSQTRRSVSRMSKQSLSRRSLRDGVPELGHHSNASNSSLLRPSISISGEEVTSKKVPVGGGSDSRRGSRLTPPTPGSPNLAPQRHSRIPSNMVPASPSPTAPFFSSSSLQSPKPEEDGLVDVSLVPHDEAGDVANLKADLTGKHLDLSDDTGSIKKQRYTFEPPPPISVTGPGMRYSMMSDMSASPTVAGSEAHFAMGGEKGGEKGGRERTMSAFIPHGQERPGAAFAMARPNSSYVPERPTRGSSVNSTGEPSKLRQSSLNSTNEPSRLRQSSLNSTSEPSPLRQSSLNSSAEPSPLRQSSINSNDQGPTSATLPTPSPTESQYVDARQSYYSHPNFSASNGSLSAFPVPPETPATGRTSMMMTPNSALQPPVNTPMTAAATTPTTPAIQVPVNTPVSAVPIVVEEPEPSLGYLDEQTPTQSPSHSRTHSRTASQGRTHARTTSQHSRTGSHARSPSQQSQMQAVQAQRRAQEAQRAAFMAALDEPLPPPRRPRVPGQGGSGGGGGLMVAQDQQARMSAYHLTPAQEASNAAQFNRYSYAPGSNVAGMGARPFPQTEAGGSGSGPQRSSYVTGSPQRRGPFMSNPSPFNPNTGNGGPSS